MNIMPTSNGVASTVAQPAQPEASAAPRAVSSDFETFLKMLTAQIKNQDPLDPMDSADYAVQLATFSSVEQQVLTNDLLAGMSGKAGGTGLVDFAGWVGRDARAAMPARFDGAVISVTPKVAPGADHAEVVVTDGTGLEVQRFQIPSDSEGFDWAGTDRNGRALPPGLYAFDVVSRNGDEILATARAEVYGRVREVQVDETGPVLVLGSGARISVADVTALRDAG